MYSVFEMYFGKPAAEGLPAGGWVQENLVILDAVLEQARTLKNDVILAFLDLAKAFDSVSR